MHRRTRRAERVDRPGIMSHRHTYTQRAYRKTSLSARARSFGVGQHANQLAAFPLFSFEFCLSPSSPSARGGGVGLLIRAGRRLFSGRLKFPRLLWYAPPFLSCFKTVHVARAGQPARCSSGAGEGPSRARLPVGIIGVCKLATSESQKSQRCAFRISGLSFGAPMTDRLDPWLWPGLWGGGGD